MTSSGYWTCIECGIGYFNLFPSQICLTCPLKNAYCKGALMKLPPGWWRQDQYTADIVSCSNSLANCVGNLDPPSNLKALYDDFYCQQGYVGALC